jgi:DNA helicase-2/ATP-dependent DNA helicase PcrA
MKIPYRIYGGQRFYERLEIKNALGYLRLVLSRDDDQGFERVVNTPTRGIGNKTIDDVRALARSSGISLWQAAVQLIKSEALTARAANALSGFLQLIDKLALDIGDLPLHEGVDHLLTATGLLEFHRAEKGERGQARVDNLFELVSACKSFEAEDDELPVLPQFLAQATLEAGDQQAEAHEDAVQLMTFHSAKGLEFPVVIMAGMEENLFPHSMSAEEPGRLEEERRLCYVGITRAMKKLVLSYAESRRLHGEERHNAVSRFVRDVPTELIEEVRVKQTSRPLRAPSSSGSRRQFSTSDPGMATGFELGQRVSHPSFGPGVILSFEGQGAHARVQVNFDQVGSKWLVLSYARLEQA